VPFIMMAYRATQHSSTGFTPNRLFLGRENKAPLDVALGLPGQDRGRPKLMMTSFRTSRTLLRDLLALCVTICTKLPRDEK